MFRIFRIYVRWILLRWQSLESSFHVPSKNWKFHVSVTKSTGFTVAVMLNIEEMFRVNQRLP